MKTKQEIKKYFENGDKPTQEQFWEWQDSYWHKDEKLENTIPLSGTENGENVTGKITSEASTVLVADWEKIETGSGARLTQEEGFVIDKGIKAAQLQSDSLRIIDNSAQGNGALISVSTAQGIVANKLYPLTSPYQYTQKEHLLSDYYTKPQVDSLVERLYKIKGSVPDFDSLPSSGNTLGDVYNLSDNGDNYVWADHNNDGIGYWDKLSGLYDLSSYATQVYVDEKLGADEGGVWNFPV
jgi:hypothetical protein